MNQEKDKDKKSMVAVKFISPLTTTYPLCLNCFVKFYQSCENYVKPPVFGGHGVDEGTPCTICDEHRPIFIIDKPIKQLKGGA